MEPKVSIIIPAYHAEKTIEKCLESVINQTYKNLEIIVINDGSKDNTYKKILNYCNDKRIIAINQKNCGVSKTRNRGIKKSTGEYIIFIDADDWIESVTIEELVRILQKENVDVVRYNCFYQENKKITIPSLYNLSNKKIIHQDFEQYKVVEHFLLNKEPIKNFVMLLIIKKEIFKSSLMFKEDLYMMEDVYFYLNLFTKIKSIYFFDKALYHYCDNENSATKSSSKYEKNIYGIIDTNKYIKEYLIKNNIMTLKIKELNGNHLRIISYYLYYIYREFGRKSFISVYKKLYKNLEFKEMVGNISLNELSNYWKIIGNLIKLRLSHLICFVFYVRKIRERRIKNDNQYKKYSN